jgi:hypothetical protein
MKKQMSMSDIWKLRENSDRPGRNDWAKRTMRWWSSRNNSKEPHTMGNFINSMENVGSAKT